jgi:hypothetical protein
MFAAIVNLFIFTIMDGTCEFSPTCIMCKPITYCGCHIYIDNTIVNQYRDRKILSHNTMGHQWTRKMVFSPKQNISIKM